MQYAPTSSAQFADEIQWIYVLIMQESLLPSIIDKDSPNYSAVVMLREILEYSLTKEGEKIRNVALTGPYGSGKSSVLFTLQKECQEAASDSPAKKLKFLPISLALLKGGNESEALARDNANNRSNDSANQNTTDEELINRRIEYSILQQLVYREPHSVVPDSRIKRIHSSKSKLNNSFLFKIFMLFACIFILFEPTLLKVDTIFNILNFGKYNIIGDIAALGYIIWFSWRYLLPEVSKVYHKYRVDKIEIKGAEIKMESENSIFNHHLDEILYFFSQTEYNIIVIEDLDRFNTSSIFLKLRELSMLLNESKIVDRHITFVYAIKDDMFKDEDRVKFFDHIVTVIPFINGSNSKDILKKKLLDNGVSDQLISDDAISDRAFFIHDMRLLINIINEFCQYRRMLSIEDEKRLNMTKLLGMIVYKNFYPKDFNSLHRRQGKIYQALQQRDKIEEEVKKQFSCEEKELLEMENQIIQSRDKSIIDIRLSFMSNLLMELNIPTAGFIRIDRQFHSLTEISSSDDLFEKLLNLNSFEYGYWDSYRRYDTSSLYSFSNIRISTIAKNFKLEEKLSSIQKDHQDKIRQKRQMLNYKYAQVTRKPLGFYLTNFPNAANLPCFKEIGLPDMLILFLQEGYIDENYYDYISFFYDGMLSETDNDWLLNMKLHRNQDYQFHFNHLENLVKLLKLSHFDHLSILNIDILDYLYEHREGPLEAKFNALVKRIKNSDLPQDFLYCYSQVGKHKDEVLGDYFTWDEETTWILADEYSQTSESETLKALWCKYTQTLPECTQDWLESNFSFLINNLAIIGDSRINELISACIFERLTEAPKVLIDTVVSNNSFVINYENIELVLLTILGTSDGHPSFSSILSSGSDEFIQYLTDKENINLTLEVLRSHEPNETETGCLFVVNNLNLTEDQKVSYLREQNSRISNIALVEKPSLELTVANDLVIPVWQNVCTYYQSKGLNEPLIEFIKRGYENISTTTPNECVVSSTPDWNLCKELLISDILPIKIHKKLSASLKFEVTPEDSLSTLDSSRFKNLVESNIVKCEDNFLNCLDNTDNLGILIESSPQQYFHYVEDKELSITPKSAIYLLNSSVLSKKEKENVFWTISPSTICNDASLMKFASEILIKSDETGQWKGSEILSLVSRETPNDWKQELWLKSIRKDGTLVPNILSQMGSSYSDILKSDKRPTYPNDDFHKSLLNELVRLEYIKSFHPHKTGLRVFH